MKILRFAILTGLFISLFIPLIIADGVNGENRIFAIFNLLFPVNLFFPYITGKAFLFAPSRPEQQNKPKGEARVYNPPFFQSWTKSFDAD